MAVRNSCLVRGVAAASGSRVLFQQNAYEVALIKAIHLRVPSSDASAYVQLYMHAPDGTSCEIVSQNFGTVNFFVLETWFCLNLGDELLADVGSQPLSYWVSGAGLTA